MDRRTKMILSAIGIAAVVVPALLLVFLTSKTNKEPQIAPTSRQIDTGNIEKTVKKVTPTSLPLPSPATFSATPSEGSPSAR